MKIVYAVLKGMPQGGGIEKYTEEVGSRLVSRGHEVIVYTMSHYGNPGEYHKGMRIIQVPSIKVRSMEKLSAAFMASLFQIAERDVDLVHFHAFGPSAFAAIPRLFGCKVIVQGHGLEWKRSRWGRSGQWKNSRPLLWPVYSKSRSGMST